MKITIIAGTRPNFVKVAAILKEAKRRLLIGQTWFDVRFVHTGQHCDPKLSSDIFKDLRLTEPDINLEVGSGSHAEQTAELMIKIEKELQRHKPDLVLVTGDVNSTMASAIVAKKLQITVDLNNLKTNVVTTASPLQVVFPNHPRCRCHISENFHNHSNLIIQSAQSYLYFLQIIKKSNGVIADSGGVSEEFIVFNKPCITFRDLTERP